MNQAISLRHITPADEEFLYQVYASTREDELAVTPWTAAEKEIFLRMQFRAQHTFYLDTFGEADFWIILRDGGAIGRLYVDERQDEVRVIDIALLPAYRRMGIGSAILQDILTQAQQKKLPVRIHVEQNNPALSLYTRLGFRQADVHGMYLLLEWIPKQESDHT